MTRRHIPLAGSSSYPQETVTDGWYVDLDDQLSCDRKCGKRVHWYASLANQRPEKLEFVDIGESERGFAVQQAMVSKGTYTLQDGSKKQTDSRSEILVTELGLGPLDPGLFEVPPPQAWASHRAKPKSVVNFQSDDRFWGGFKAKVASLFEPSMKLV